MASTIMLIWGYRVRKTLIAAAICGSTLLPFAAFADTSSDIADLKRIVAEQQKRIENLERQIATQSPPPATTAAATSAPAAPISPAEAPASPVSTAQSTSIGGYGEVIFNDLDSQKTTDVERFVVFFGHQFDAHTRFGSELEIEHQFIENADGEAEGGEVEAEQAWVEHDWNDWLKTKAGYYLMPVGIINEHHEPPTFYGVNRNPVETFIIPSTWSDKGILTTATFANGLSVDFGFSGGLHVENEDAGEEFLPEHATPEGVGAANSPAYTGRVLYRGIPGLELGVSGLYQVDGGQGTIANVGHAEFLEAHGIYQFGNAELRALYARFMLTGAAPKALNRDKQDGGYVEASYRILQPLGLFARYNVWDNGGLAAKTVVRQTNVGVNYWLVPDVVLKADLQWQSGATDLDGLNLGLGYQF